MTMRCLVNSLLLVLALHNGLLGLARPEGYVHIDCTLRPIVPKSERISHPHIPATPGKAIPKNQAVSTNWSGYVAANNLNNPAQNSVTSVSGSWIVPSVKSSNNNTYCAIWIGIDGYASSTVEQLGTAHDCINGQVQHYAWIEMYPGGSYGINGFPVNPGDVISSSIVYSGNNVFTMQLNNDTQKVFFTVPTSYTTSASALRNSAEWIVEAPYLNGILPLSNFVTAYLWGCNATINDALRALSNTSWQSASLEMITNNSLPKAIPSTILQDEGSFFVTWRHQ